MQDIAITVFGLAGLLALVSFLPPIANRLTLPYTVLLALVGCALGAIAAAARDDAGMGMAGDFVEALKGFDISAEVFLYVFLPVLLFEAGLVIDVRRLMDDIAPVLLMAVVAVFVCTAVVGLALAPFAPVGMLACLLLGAIVATTDPAAVIGIFRDLGAPRRLSILVEGESVFNDAAAIALFTLLLGLLTGAREGGLLETAVDFATSFLGGAAVGYVAARIACWVVGALRGLRLAEITLTVALAYTVYVIADRYLGVSGVVAVVTAALVMGSTGRTRITPSTWDSLIETWQQLAFWANSLVFILAAMLVPRLLTDIGFNDALLLGVLVLATLVARALVLWGLLPPLALFRPATRVSGPYKLVILWGGLRGAVSMALALAITEHEGLPAEIRHFVAVLTTGYVLFTLFVQGPTLRPLIRALGLDRLSPAERAVRDRALALARDSIRERIEGIAAADGIGADAVAEVTRELERRTAGLDAAAPAAALSEADRVYIGLATLATREHELALERFQERLIARKIAHALMAQAGRMLDGVKTAGRQGYEAAASHALAFPRDFRFAQILHQRIGLAGPLADALADRFETLQVGQLVLRDLIAFNDRRLAPLLGSATGETLAAILGARAAAIEQALEALRLQYPEYFAALQERYLGRVALRLEEDGYRTMFAESVVSQEIFNDLDRGVAQRWRMLDRRPALDIAMKPVDMIARVPLFAGLEQKRLAEIARLLKPRLAVPGERVIAVGERGDAMYFLDSGAAEVRLPGGPIRLGSGDFFGEIALLHHQPRIADVVALGYCRLLVLSAVDFRRLLLADPELRRSIDQVARQRLGRPMETA